MRNDDIFGFEIYRLCVIIIKAILLVLLIIIMARVYFSPTNTKTTMKDFADEHKIDTLHSEIKELPVSYKRGEKIKSDTIMPFGIYFIL